MFTLGCFFSLHWSRPSGTKADVAASPSEERKLKVQEKQQILHRLTLLHFSSLLKVYPCVTHVILIGGTDNNNKMTALVMSGLTCQYILQQLELFPVISNKQHFLILHVILLFNWKRVQKKKEKKKKKGNPKPPKIKDITIINLIIRNIERTKSVWDWIHILPQEWLIAQNKFVNISWIDWIFTPGGEWPKINVQGRPKKFEKAKTK